LSLVVAVVARCRCLSPLVAACRSLSLDVAVISLTVARCRSMSPEISAWQNYLSHKNF